MKRNMNKLPDGEKQKELIDKAKEVFGTTDECDRAGYILPDGKMLDFGIPDMKERKGRYLDHSEVWQVYSHFPEIKRIDGKICFRHDYNDQFLLETGAIRFNATSHYQMTGEMFQPNLPTRKQLETLEYCSCILRPTEKIIMELAKCDKEGKYVPKTFSERVSHDCVEPINDLNKKIKKWQSEKSNP